MWDLSNLLFLKTIFWTKVNYWIWTICISLTEQIIWPICWHLCIYCFQLFPWASCDNHYICTHPTSIFVFFVSSSILLQIYVYVCFSQICTLLKVFGKLEKVVDICYGIVHYILLFTFGFFLLLNNKVCLIKGTQFKHRSHQFRLSSCIEKPKRRSWFSSNC